MNALVPKNEYSGFDRIAAEETGGRIIKFSKDGHWIAGLDEENLDGCKMLADMDNLAVGWRKWKDSKIVANDVGFVRDNFIPKERNELDEVNEATWPKNNSGLPNDPWQWAYYLRFIDEDGNIYMWTASSSGARRCIGELSRQYRRKLTNPIVELSAGSYKHRQYGKINTPVLKVVDWSDDTPALTDARPKPGAAPAPVDLDDSIPF
jgi:hypothetical protein